MSTEQQRETEKVKLLLEWHRYNVKQAVEMVRATGYQSWSSDDEFDWLRAHTRGVRGSAGLLLSSKARAVFMRYSDAAMAAATRNLAGRKLP